ncbi:hypothetical protein [Clostridium sp. ZBS13]|uniref:hypothetical protein n=1 Tax=Clostridium sp. ZBS13 TaxID=2949971 RepID=UPI00207A43E7|nr:hypothetical protein [Clostridium sp. ZBS13]
MTSATNSSGNSVSRLCNIINITQNDIISSAVDKCWAPEVSGPSIEVFPAHNDEGIIITDIPVTEVPSITILDTPAMVEQPNNVEVFPEQRVDIPIIIDFPAEKQNEKDNIIFIDGVSKAIEDILSGVKETTNGKGVARNFEKSGGYEQTLKDFDSLNPTNVKDIQTQYGPGKVGILSDGTKVVARQGSTTGGPTLEITVSKKKIFKVRY